jgi:hypothetical protein
MRRPGRSKFTGLSIKELDDEMYRRELVLELMMDYDLTQKDIHRFVQDYYKNKYGTLESLHDEIKSLKDVQKIEDTDDKKTKVDSIREWTDKLSAIK